MGELMDATASNFSNRSNAKRAAEKMIAKGTAPTVDYGIKPSDDGRFEIVWKTASTTDEAEAEIAAAIGEPGKTGTDWFPGTEGTHFAGVPLPETETAVAAAAAHEPALSELAPITAQPEPENKWPDGTRVMVRKRKSWREATIVRRLDPDYWRVEYPGGGTGMFQGPDIRAYEAERDAKPAKQPRPAKATEPKKASRSRYAIDPKAIAAGKVPDKAPVVTSAANPHYQKHFDRLFGLAKVGDWDAVRDYEVKGSNSYSKMVARYRQDLLAVHAAASEAAE
jgi:hypothetical protein